MGLSPWSGSWWGALLLPGETEGVARIPHPAPWQGQAPTAARTPAWGGVSGMSSTRWVHSLNQRSLVQASPECGAGIPWALDLGG